MPRTGNGARVRQTLVVWGGRLALPAHNAANGLYCSSNTSKKFGSRKHFSVTMLVVFNFDT